MNTTTLPDHAAYAIAHNLAADLQRQNDIGRSLYYFSLKFAAGLMAREVNIEDGFFYLRTYSWGFDQITHIALVSAGFVPPTLILNDPITYRYHFDLNVLHRIPQSGNEWVQIPMRVQRKRAKGWRMPKSTIYVGRPSLWGNFKPFMSPDHWYLLGHNGVAMTGYGMVYRYSSEETAAAAAMNLYREMVNDYLERWEKSGKVPGFFEPLLGHNLACWCPLDREPCHATVLADALIAAKGIRR